MKHLCKALAIFFAVAILVTAFTACSSQETIKEDDAWMQGDAEMDSSSDSARYARPQEEQEDDAAPQSGDSLTLPFIPLG